MLNAENLFVSIVVCNTLYRFNAKLTGKLHKDPDLAEATKTPTIFGETHELDSPAKGLLNIVQSGEFGKILFPYRKFSSFKLFIESLHANLDKTDPTEYKFKDSFKNDLFYDNDQLAAGNLLFTNFKSKFELKLFCDFYNILEPKTEKATSRKYEGFLFTV